MKDSRQPTGKKAQMGRIYANMVKKDPKQANYLPPHKASHQTSIFVELLKFISSHDDLENKDEERFINELDRYLKKIAITHVSKGITSYHYDLMEESIKDAIEKSKMIIEKGEVIIKGLNELRTRIEKKEEKVREELSLRPHSNELDRYLKKMEESIKDAIEKSKMTIEQGEAIIKSFNDLRTRIEKEEEKVREELSLRPHSFEGFKNFSIIKIEKETKQVTSLYLKAKDGSELPPFFAGQHVTVRVPYCSFINLEHTSVMGVYSISNKPGEDYWRLTVKNVNGNVSGSLCYNEVEDEIELSMPNGVFYFDPQIHNKDSLILIGRDIENTPLQSILLEALDETPDRNILFVDFNKNLQTSIFHRKIDQLSRVHDNFTVKHLYTNCREKDRKLKDLFSKEFLKELLQSLITKGCSFEESDCFLSSKQDIPFLTEILTELEVDLGDIHYESSQCPFLEAREAEKLQCPLLGQEAL